MKAFRLNKYGPHETLHLDEIPLPQLGPDQVLVKVAAAGLNPIDNLTIHGRLKQLITYKLPHTLGSELAGKVVDTGENVTRFKVGDEVYGRVNTHKAAAFAEYAAVDTRDLSSLPGNLSPEQAAGLPLVLLTAIQAFTEKTRIGPGNKVFIQGGTGGLGSVAIQVAKHLGATVATTVSTPNLETAQKLGADTVIDYRTQKYEDILKNYDTVLDTLGRAETIRAMSVLKPGGTLLTVSGAPDKSVAQLMGKPYLGPVLQFLSRKERKAARRAGINYRFLFMQENGKQLDDYRPLIENGIIVPLIGEIIDFVDIPQGLKNIASGQSKPGKTVAVMPAPATPHPTAREK